MDKAGQAKEILAKILYATIATVTPTGGPWNSPVYGEFDEEFNFYWASWQKNVHSQNIRANGQAFLVVYDSTVPEGTGKGVYIRAEAAEVHDRVEIEHAATFIYQRKHKKPRLPEEFMGEYPRRIYKAVPKQIWMNSGSEIKGNFIDIREEIQLEF